VDEAIATQRSAIALLPLHCADRHRYLSYLGMYLRKRYDILGTSDDLEEAIGLLREATEACPPTHVDRESILVRLGHVLFRRFELAGRLQDLEDALDMTKLALTSGLPASQQRVYILSNLCNIAFWMRFIWSGEARDLEEAIGFRREALKELPPNSPQRWVMLVCMGSDLCSRFKELGQMDDLNEAVQLHRIAVANQPSTDFQHLAAVTSLLSALCIRFRVLRSPEDLEEGIRIGEEHLQKRSDLEEAVVLMRHAMESCPPTHVDRECVLVRSSHVLFRHFELCGDTQDLEDSLKQAKAALTVGRPTSQQRVYSLSNVANILEYFIEHRACSDSILDELVGLRQEAINISPEGFHGHLALLDCLANAMRMRFSWKGQVVDLEEAIEIHRHRIHDTGTGDPHRLNCLFNLGEELMMRFKELGRIEDLDEAIELHRTVLDEESPAHFQHLNSVAGMLSALRIRFRARRSVEDLEEAIVLAEENLQNTPIGNRWRGNLIQELSNSLLLRGEYNGNSNDIDRAIQLLEPSDVYAPGSLIAPEQMRIVGLAHMARFRQTQHADDAVRSRAVMTELLQRVISEQRDCFEYLLDVSELYLEAGTEYRNIALALDHLMQCVAADHRDVRSRIQGGLLGIYSMIVSMLPRVAYFGTDPHSRLRSLAIGQHVAANAALHAIDLSQAERALEILEQGRAIFWTHILRLRSRFESVPDDMRDRLLVLAQKLEKNSDISEDLSERHLVEKALGERRRCSDEFDALLDQVRRLPGFERFMLHDEFSTLVRAADCGPVVVLIASAIGCSALIVTKMGGPKCVPLPALDEAWVLESGQRWRAATAEARSAVRTRLHLQKVKVASKKTACSPVAEACNVLGGLWTKIVEPVLAALYLKPAVGRARPRLWWCPTGHLVHFPIHAACKGGRSCSDYVVSSYTPTLSALLSVRREFTPVRLEDSAVLLAAVPRPFVDRWTELPSTLDEIAAVEAVVPRAAVLTLDASKAHALLDNLPRATVLHLACHGLQESKNPLKSGFVMSDRMLTIENLMDVPLPRAFLAFLSACETAKGDAARLYTLPPDQTVNLAATMLFSGFKSVIATLWSMEDVDGPLIATLVYKELFRAGKTYLDPDDVPYALDAAIQELRRAHPEPSRWAPYVHLGM
ncbi:hypothetical protein PUNSTDRAFT_28588, partial [Punctularia strigosozonata HHB-11173 SS5]|uniref:uncharacterized protein n=1 Tax=Punctularia strigosozonata (strain HHB-11173) TaxID=741275 RepID=UPI0004416C6E